MDIKKLIGDQKLIVEGDFKGNKIRIQYVDPHEWREMRRKSTIKKWINHQPVEDVDDDLWSAEMSKIIHGWDIKNKDLAKFFPIKPDAEYNPEELVECTEENKITFFEHAYGFGLWLTNFVSEIQNFREAQNKADTKN